MRKSWLIAAVIGGAAGAAQAADVQLFGIHIPQTKQYAVYSVVSNAASSSPLPGRTTVAGISSMWIEVLNNGGATVATAQNRLPVGTHNDATAIDPRYGFWVFQPPQPTIDPAVGALEIRGGQFTEYPKEQAAQYDPYVLQRVGMEPGAKAAPPGGSAANWAMPVLVARGTFNGDAGTTGLKLQYHAGSGVNLLKDMDPNPDVVNYTGADLTPADLTDDIRVEGATNSTVVDARTWTTKTLTPGTTTVKAGLGDANLDGTVNFTDLVALAQNYGSSSRSWFQGDFNLDNEVNFNDLVSLAQNYGQPVPASGTFGASFEADLAAAFAQVPEPSALTLVGLAAAGLVGRRRRK